MNTCLKNTYLLFAFAIVLLSTACQQPDGNNPGSEYMPDMGHSIAYEANHYDYYYHNTWGTEQEYYKMSQPRKPVAGTIPRGFAGVHYASNKAQAMSTLNGGNSNIAIKVPVNGNVPYYYADTDDERTRATAEIQKNPFPITDKGLKDAKELYDIYCGICHGDKGDGDGYIVRDDGGVYPAQPANLISDEFIAASNGRFYHAIMYGKNVMGDYRDKLSYGERWQVIHYIRSLQAKEKKLVYSESLNSLNSDSLNVPGASVKMIAKHVEEAAGQGDSDAGHSHEGGDGDGHDGGH